MLPNVYDMDDYKTCIQNGNEYFKATVNLSPNTSENNIWKIIQERKNMSHMYYDRSTVYRWMCVPKELASNSNSTTEYVYGELYSRFQNYGLVPHIENMYHFDYRKHENDFNMWTLFIILLYVCYIMFVIFATYYTIKSNKKENSESGWIEAFSLERNWKMLTSPPIGGSAGELSSFQTVRAVMVFLVMIYHFAVITVHMYASNFDSLEKSWQQFFPILFIVLGFFVAQPLFLMSSFLLVNQICDIHSKNGELTLWDCWCLFINRIFRLWPTMLVVWWILVNHKFPYVPQLAEVVDTIENGCGNHYMAFFFFFNNWLPVGKMCHPATWYISADTQLYVATILIFYTMLKLKLNMMKTLFYVLIFSILRHAAIRYYFELDVMSKMGPETCIREKFLLEIDYILQYTALISIWTTTLIGALAGYTFYHTKNKEIKIQNWVKWIIMGLSIFTRLAIALVVVFLRSRPLSSRLATSLVGAIVKPIFAIGSGIFILSAALGILPEKIQKSLNCKPLVIMGNFSFGMYIWHLFPAIFRGAYTDGLFRFQMLDSIVFLCFLYVAGSVLAVFFTLFLEQPFFNLQKKILPQIKKRKDIKDL